MKGMKWLVPILVCVFIIGCKNDENNIGKGKKAKYIFYFIGDGMGSALVHGTQLFLAEQKDKIGVEELSFTDFPVHNSVITHSSFNAITCSAAGGTAMSCGERTSNGTIGMDACHTRALTNIAQVARDNGFGVGILTSVSIDHATPAAFFAHQPRRSMSYEIACEGIGSGIDVLGGSGFLETVSDNNDINIYERYREKGYITVHGLSKQIANPSENANLMLLPHVGADSVALEYAINRDVTDVTLSNMVETSIRFLKERGKKGFFMMAEGGKIDWACHNNDGATAIREVIDLSNAVNVALEFYKRYPDETLILVTADHETGGISLGTRGYDLNLRLLSEQTKSAEFITSIVNGMHDNEVVVSWDMMRDTLVAYLGKDACNWDYEQTLRLRNIFDDQFLAVSDERAVMRNHYATINPLVQAAIGFMNDNAGMGWSTLEHSAVPVPLFAIGAGAHYFMGKQLYNLDIPHRIEQAAGWRK
ncbi:MAG: alkaline phosphatase [Marinifilaceae bacterium]